MTTITSSVNPIYEKAAAEMRAGNLAEAETLLRRLLAADPDHVQALFMMGLILLRANRLLEASVWFRRAIMVQPDLPEAHFNLGHALNLLNQHEESAEAFRKGLEFRPDHPQALSNLGEVLRHLKETDEALKVCKRSVEIDPKAALAQNNLGSIYHDLGELDAALEHYQRAIELKPDFALAVNNIGGIYGARKQWDQAVEYYEQAIKIQPKFDKAYCNLAVALLNAGKTSKANAACTQALQINPFSALANGIMGNCLVDDGKCQEAINYARRAIELSKNYPEAHNTLGRALFGADEVDAAIAEYERAIALNPNMWEAHNNLANALHSTGQIEGALDSYQAAIRLKRDDAQIHSNFVYAMLFSPESTPQSIREAQRDWSAAHEAPLAGKLKSHNNDRTPDRRLRIGYLSPDFRRHVVAWNMLPILEKHDRQKFEIVCYSNWPLDDESTHKVHSHADQWRRIAGMSDEKVAETIRADDIDILIDLSLHSAHNRLLTFALQPAPVQISYLGYCGAAGLSAIDCRVSDPNLDPPGSEKDYLEKTVRLPHSYWCYQPGVETPPVGKSPAKQTGRITFGCLNSFAKISRPARKTWIDILSKVENSRLLLFAQSGRHRDELGAGLAEAGIAPERLEFIARQSPEDYFRAYQRIDIALDPFPFNGGITTCDALWMGVPVVTLEGKTSVGRAGKSILSNVGLPELVAADEKRYVAIAAELASDRARLEKMRSTLRAKLQSSPLMDVAGFTRDWEAMLRQAWQSWCESKAV